MREHPALRAPHLQIPPDAEDLIVQQRQLTLQAIKMADGVTKRDQRQDIAELGHLLGRKCKSQIAKAEISAQLVLKEVQGRAVKLHPF